MLSADWSSWILRAVRAGGTRSLLTAIGIAIGIAAVTLLTSIGEGIRLYMLESFSQFGTRIVAITPGRVTTQGGAGLLSTIRPLSLADAEALRALPHVEAVVPVVQGTARVEAAARPAVEGATAGVIDGSAIRALGHTWARTSPPSIGRPTAQVGSPSPPCGLDGNRGVRSACAPCRPPRPCHPGSHAHRYRATGVSCPRQC